MKFNTVHIVCSLVLGYLFTRLVSLTVLPMFTDEAIYIYWAKFIQTNHSNWFISLTDGKPPLLIWMISLLLTVLPADWYLVAGRLPSVFAGTVTIVGLWTLCRHLFPKTVVAPVAVVLYILSPFALTYDRLALYDSLLASTMVWSIYFALRTADTHKHTDAYAWGLTIGLGFLSKSPAVMYWMLLPALLTVSNIKRSFAWTRFAVNAVTASSIAILIQSTLRVSSVYHLMDAKNSQFQRSISAILQDPFHNVHSQLRTLVVWQAEYVTPVVFITAVLGLLLLVRHRPRLAMILAGLWILPLMAFAVVASIIFPRYIFFTVIPLYICAAFAFEYAMALVNRDKQVIIRIFLILVMTAQANVTILTLLTNPAVATGIPETDYEQLVSNHPSGYGLTTVYQRLDEEIAKHGTIVLVTEGTFGLLPYSPMLRYWDDPRITIDPRWPLEGVPVDLGEKYPGKTVYILYKDKLSAEQIIGVDPLLRIDKPGGKNNPLILVELDKESKCRIMNVCL